MARVAAVAALASLVAPAWAGSDGLRFCDGGAALTPRQQDRLLRVAAWLQQALEGSGQAVALVSRSGLNLRRFGLRYSHAGVSLRSGLHRPWAVRQLYYACDEGQPRLFDQGLAGFLMGTDDAEQGHVSVLLLPAGPGAALAQAALDNAGTLQLLGARYSANAYPFSTRYQNCNQWLAELLASAWGGLAGAAPGSPADQTTQPLPARERAQAWLRRSGYNPAPVPVGSHALMFAGAFVPWLRYDDHPEADRFALQFRTSVPATIEAFVQQHHPGAQRIELCHTAQHMVVRRQGLPLPDDCVADVGDEVLALD